MVLKYDDVQEFDRIIVAYSSGRLRSAFPAGLLPPNSAYRGEPLSYSASCSAPFSKGKIVTLLPISFYQSK